MNRETEGNNYRQKDLEVKAKRGKDITPATIGALDTSGTIVEPDKTPVSHYTVKESKAKGANPATVGAFNSDYISACQAIDPAKTPPKAYTVKTK